MAPEVAGERPTFGHPADVFGFGLVTLFLVTGPGNFPLGSGVTGMFPLYKSSLAIFSLKILFVNRRGAATVDRNTTECMSGIGPSVS